MANYSVTDISVRLAKLRCCISEKAQKLVLNKKYGTATWQMENQLLLLVAYEWIISGYRVGSSYNDITETELDHIFNMVQRICNLAFAPKGYQYFNNEPVEEVSNILLNDGSSSLLLNDGSSYLLLNS